MQENDIDEGIARYQESTRFTPAEKLALRYSELMALDPARIDEGFYRELRRHYSDEEIIELGSFIGFNIGYHTFFGTLKFYPMFSPDGRLVTQEESQRIYGMAPASLAGRADGRTTPVTRISSPLFVTRISSLLSDMHIEPLKPEDIRDPELQALIDRCVALGVPDAVFPRVLARVPEYAKPLLRALLASHAEGSVDHRLKEIIRIQLARTAGDPYFANLRSARAQRDGLTEETIEAGCGRFESDPQFTAAERWALRYAREMYLDPERVDAAFYAEGKRHYTEAQIMELGAFIAFHYGMQAFARTLRLRE